MISYYNEYNIYEYVNKYRTYFVRTERITFIASSVNKSMSRDNNVLVHDRSTAINFAII